MKALNDYLKLDYPITIYHAPEGGYVAEIEDLSGCITEGETLDEALERIEDARRAWIEVTYEDGQEIPLPRTEQEYSGKFLVRIPKYLHRRLVEMAEREGVSLNQLVVTILASSSTSQDKKIEELTQEISNLAQSIVSNQPPFIYSPADMMRFTWEMREEEEKGQPVYRKIGVIEKSGLLAV